MTNKCIMCDMDRMQHRLPTSTGQTLCETWIYDDETCYSVLAPEQYTRGHALVILKKHKVDITDQLSNTDMGRFISAVHWVAVRLKEVARNTEYKSPERIYVCMLCDGEEHIHAHLIPRYPFTKEDEYAFSRIFMPRSGDAWVHDKISKGKLGGFWYAAERERVAKDPTLNEARNLEQLAKELRFSKSHAK